MPVTPDMNKLLADIGALQAIPSSRNGALARQILLGTSLADPKTVTNLGPAGESGGPSVVSRIFDVLSRPNYAIANLHSKILEHQEGAIKSGGDPVTSALEPVKHPVDLIQAIGEGLSGKSKKTYSDVLDQVGMDSGAKRAVLGFVLDVATDPTTYIGAGAIKSVGKKILGKSAESGTKAIEEVAKTSNVVEDIGKVSAVPESAVPPVGALPTKSAPGARASNQPKNIKFSPEAIAALGKANIPGKHASDVVTPKDISGQYKADFKLFMDQAKAAKAAKEGTPVGPKPKKADYPNIQEYAKAISAWKANRKLPNDFPAQVDRAHDLVDKIVKGDVEAAVKATPKPPSTPPATAAQSNLGKAIARNSLSKNSKAQASRLLTPVDQFRVFNNIIKTTVGTPVQRITQAIQVLRESEKFFKSQGINMAHWDGLRVPLSEVIDEMGGPTRVSMEDLLAWSKNKHTPGIDEAVERIRARSVMQDTPIIALGIDQTIKQASIAEKVMSPAKYADFRKTLDNELVDGLKTAGVAPGATYQAKELLNTILKANEGVLQNSINRNAASAKKVVSGGSRKEWQKVNGAVTAQMEKMVGKTEKQAGESMGAANKALEFLGLRFASHYGVKDLRPTTLDYLLSAEANAERRHRLWRKLVKSTSADERALAFKIAQGHLPAENYPMNMRAASVSFKFAMESLFSSSAIKDYADSVALRAGFVREDLNKELRILGSEHYFDDAPDLDWLRDWEKWDIKGDPVNQMAKLETAAERLSKKYGLLDEISERWGSKTPTGEYRHKVGHPRFEGVYFPQEMVPQIQRTLDTMENMYNPKSPMMKYLDEVLSMWKTAVTIYSPSHHIRNAIGDAWLSWVSGVNNPKVYSQALRVMKAQKGRYTDSIGVNNLTSNNPQIRTRLQPILTTKNGKQLNADDIYIAAHKRGLLLSARQIEDIFGEPILRGKIQPFGGRVHDAASSVSENREHFFRLAHFIDAVKKSKAKNVEEAFNEAAHQVRKWHPDGMDLTNFEKKYMRRIFPFYSWTRKALPLVLESIVMKPGKVMAYPKGMQALQEAMGIESPDRGDPFPTDQLFPDWIREKGIGPIGLTGAGGIAGFFGDAARQGVDSSTGQPIGGYAQVNPSNPMIDLVAQLGGMGDAQSGISAIGESLNPGLRIPAELLTGHDVRTQAPIRESGQQFADYATNQIPIASILSRLTNVGIAGPTSRGENEGFGNLEALINQLTALGLQGTGPYVKQAQYEQRDRLRNAY